MVERLFEFLLLRRKRLSSLSLELVVIFGLGCATGWYVHSSFIAERVGALNERLRARDDLLDEYRERLGILNPTRTTLAALSHGELQARCTSVAGRLRAFSDQEERESRAMLDRRFRLDVSKGGEADSFEGFSKEMLRRSLESKQRYDSQLRADAILCRDELRSRLPPSAFAGVDFWAFEVPTNTFGYQKVAEDLERMSKMLK